MISTIIVNPQKQARDKIASLLSTDVDIHILAQGKDGYDALKLVGNFKPDIALLNSHLEIIEGEEIPPLLRLRSPSTAVVIVAAKINDYQLYRAAINEVSGIVYQETDFDKLPEILKFISTGGGFISPALVLRVLHLLSSQNNKGVDIHGITLSKYQAKILEGMEPQFFYAEDPTGKLSKTELRVLIQIGEGHTSDEIAKNLGFAVGTVRNYISSVMHKTGLNSRSQMVRLAFSCGLVPFCPHCGAKGIKLQ